MLSVRQDSVVEGGSVGVLVAPAFLEPRLTIARFLADSLEKKSPNYFNKNDHM
jgi:hypothetical protein